MTGIMTQFDIAVIGGGIVGCAILQRLTSEGYKCVLLEKSDNLVSGASSGNSGIRHSGYDTDVNTLEGKCIDWAKPLADNFYRNTGVPQNKCGGIMIAWTKSQMELIPKYLQKAKDAGQHDVKVLSREEILRMEPHLATDLLGGILIPGEATIDPWLTAVVLAHSAVQQGAQIKCKSEVQSGSRGDDGTWTLTTSSGPVNAKVIINAAGLHGDTVENIHSKVHFKIMPRKGDFAIFDKSARSLVHHIILPVPTERTKGIIIFPTVYGNIVVGPTAVDVETRETSEVTADAATVDSLVKWAHRVVPGLKPVPVIGTYSGLRPATQYKDYQITAHPSSKWVTVGGIRSTGATACLGIASYVCELLGTRLNLAPTLPAAPPVFGMTWQNTPRGAMVIDGTVYNITHPITKFGLMPSSKL